MQHEYTKPFSTLSFAFKITVEWNVNYFERFLPSTFFIDEAEIRRN